MRETRETRLMGPCEEIKIEDKRCLLRITVEAERRAIGARLEELLYHPAIKKNSSGVYNVSWAVDKGVLYDAIARLRRGESP